MTSPHDPRRVCNLILELAQEGVGISNLALQKLLYFCHGLYLIETRRPLVSGHFEAWKLGPVHPVAYRAFKRAGEQNIDFRAGTVDPLTGSERPLAAIDDEQVVDRVGRVMRSYGYMSASMLVRVAHAPGAPWDVIVHKARTELVFGMRISDTVILDRFKFHKVSVSSASQTGVLVENTPFA